MGDTTDGSSSAAQGAQDTETIEERGFWGRLVDVLTPPAEERGPGKSGTGLTPRASDRPPGLVNLRRLRLVDVAIPKADIVSVALSIKKDDLVAVFRESGLSRLPVYKSTLDTPVGLVHLKDLALRHGFNGKGGPRFSLRAMLRPLLYAPPSMPLGVLLQKMQSERTHMALMIDEYGGVDGLVTIEDLIEQVVGEIEDEHDLEGDTNWSLEKPGCYLAQAKTPLEDFEAELGRSLTDGIDDEEIDTLGGLVFVLAGRVPSRGEVVRHPDGSEFEVVDADPRRIKRLRVRLPDPARAA